MDVREKLVELIQESGACFDCFPVSGYEKNQIEKIASYLIDHGATVQEWVPVTERLPEDSGYYLVVHQNKYNGSISIAFEMYIKCKIGEWWENDYAYDVTHWMPLPELPKGE